MDTHQNRSVEEFSLKVSHGLINPEATFSMLLNPCMWATHFAQSLSIQDRSQMGFCSILSYFPVVLNPFSQLKSQFQWLNSQALASAYEKCHQWPRAIRAISAFQRFALRPNGVTLNAVLSSTEAWIMALQCFTWRWAVKGDGEISREKMISLIYNIYCIYPYTLYIIILCIYNIT